MSRPTEKWIEMPADAVPTPPFLSARVVREVEEPFAASYQAAPRAGAALQ